MKYEVVSVRRSKGENFVEACFEDESAAKDYLANLALDDDCLLAEAQAWFDDGTQPVLVPIIARYERRGGNWAEVNGDLRCWTRGGVAS